MEVRAGARGLDRRLAGLMSQMAREVEARGVWGARAVIMHAGVCSRWGAVWRGGWTC